MLVDKFSDRVISGEIHCKDGVFTIVGKLHLGYREAKLHYKAAEPQDLRLSISGSALPFPNKEFAYGPVNSGLARVDEYGNFQIQIFRPNSYYKDGDIMNGIGQGKILSRPHIHMAVCMGDGQKKIYNFPLPMAEAQLRSLTGLPGKMIRSTGRNTPSFYA
tara:strand:- start:98 stop:580 length:483 start_codon:yes stop_codon:yes gene_type:complete